MKTTLKINSTINGRASHDGRFTIREFKVTKETEKAVQLTRTIESKGKEYSTWIPKNALDFFRNGDGSVDESEAFVANFIYNDSFKSWFLTAH